MENSNHHADSVVDETNLSMIDRLGFWFKHDAAWFVASLTGHVVVLLIIALVAKDIVGKKTAEAPQIEEVDTEPVPEPPAPPERFELGDPPLDPTTLDDAAMTELPSQEARTAEYIDDSAGFEAKGGGVAAGSADNFGVGGFDIKGVGQGAFFKGTGGVGIGKGEGTQGGSGGAGSGIGGRGFGHREALAASGGTRQSERAVAAALHWLAKHQMPDGSWSLDDYTKRCADATCTGHGEDGQDAAATAMGLLPFLAAGQTHQSRGTYSMNVQRGLYWLISHQKPDGDLSAGAKGNGHMYSHGICAIAMCEAAAMVPTDGQVKASAQKAINFILAAQNPGTGGWRYQPGDEGDTSVVGWQVMALKSAEMAYLNVNPRGFDGAKKWLESVAVGNYKEQFTYTPGSGATPAMSGVGLLCSQYMKVMKPGDPRMQAGVDYLMKHTPDGTKNDRNIYYWYYATQVMHNVQGPQWDDWNRQMRRLLITTQEKEGCATGSWSPDKPTKDRWGTAGGRIMVTSLSCLTLEVYYRYLPLFKLDNEKDLNKLPGLNEKGEETKKDAMKK